MTPVLVLPYVTVLLTALTVAAVQWALLKVVGK